MIASLRRALVFLLTVGLLSAGPASIGSVDTGFGAAPLRAQSSENSKYAAIVVDASTGEVLFDRFADARRYPASTTKMMTLYLTFEALEQGKVRLDDVLTVTSHAASQPPSKLGLGAGQSITLDNAMRATAVRSANDMAVALAEHIGGGSESRFTAMMTLKAQELGMTQTRYVNANGLPDGRQVTSARDLSILARAIMRDYPQYYRYFGLHDWAYNGRDYRNTNGLLATGRGYDGMKTGYINASGYNLVASAVRDGRRIITVVLGGRSSASRNAHVAELMDTGFELERRREAGERIQIAQTFFEQRGFGLGAVGFALGALGGAFLGLFARLALVRVVALRPRPLGRQGLVLRQEAGHAVGRLGALAEPFGDALGLQGDARLGAVLGQHRVVGADLLDELAVARRVRVGDDDVVVGALLGAAAGQTDLQHFGLFLIEVSSFSGSPAGPEGLPEVVRLPGRRSGPGWLSVRRPRVRASCRRPWP